MMNGKKNEGKRNSYNPDLVMIGENIRKRREALGMSQTELASGLETNRSAICRCLHDGNPCGIRADLLLAAHPSRHQLCPGEAGHRLARHQDPCCKQTRLK